MKWFKYVLYTLPVLAVLGLTGYVYAVSRPVKHIEPVKTVVDVKPEVVTPPNQNELLQLVNAERAKVGAPALTLDERLNKSAQDKCEDMIARGYWSHYGPNGEEPWVFIKKYLPSYKHAGENLARRFVTSHETVRGWVISPTHYEAMVKTDFGITGFGICSEPLPAGIKDTNAFMYEQYRIVEHFAGI